MKNESTPNKIKNNTHVTLKDIWEEVDVYSGIVSNIARQLGFGAVAICWLFKPEDNIVLPPMLLLVLLASILFFACDILQYFLGVNIHRKIAIKKEKENGGYKPEIECIKTQKDLAPIKFCYFAKLFFLLLCYILLFVYYAYIY